MAGFPIEVATRIKTLPPYLFAAIDKMKQAAIAKGVDIIIADIDDPRIAERVPEWYRRLTTTRTFVLFPLNIKGSPVALIYCDKERAGSIAIPEKELSLLKALRNQAVLAIKQSI